MSRVGRGGWALLALPLALLARGSPGQDEGRSPEEGLRRILEDVEGATGRRYGATDDRGNGLDTLKICRSPGGGYLGVYHAREGSVFSVKLATSDDLLHWTWRADLDAHASQPTIRPLATGGFLVAYEADALFLSWLRFRHYRDLPALLGGAFDRSFDAKRTLAPTNEGTPSIREVALREGIDRSEIVVGHHFYERGVVDRQARGRLADFARWSTAAEPALNGALERAGAEGNFGDRDEMAFEGSPFTLVEAQLRRGDFSSWRAFLFEEREGHLLPLHPRTRGGSTAFANPTLTLLPSPAGRPAVVVTYYLFGEGAAPGEAGELIFYRELGP